MPRNEIISARFKPFNKMPLDENGEENNPEEENSEIDEGEL